MTAGQIIDAYLSEVTTDLPGPVGDRRDIAAELRAGLLDALDAHRDAGLPEDAAAAAATAEFGDPRQLAAAFKAELCARLARRVALLIAGTGPLVGLLWIGAAVASRIRLGHALLSGWAGAPADWAAAAPVVLAGLAVTISGVLVTMAATGPLARRLAGRPRVAPALAAASGFGAMTVDLAVFAVLAAVLVSTPGQLSPLPVAAAGLASLARLLFARNAARRCLAARAALA